MKRILLHLIPLLILIACKKNDGTPREETITKGSKWNLQIGAPAAEVYAQLQKLGTEQAFNDVAVVGQQPFVNPSELQQRLQYYQAVTIMNTSGRQERAVILFKDDKVGSVNVGSSLPVEAPLWPQDVPEATAIHTGDPLSAIYEKLNSLYQIPQYKSYQLWLPDKPLNRPFDPSMANFEEWRFTMFDNVAVSKTGRSTVSLFFKNGRLIKIKSIYDEFEVYI